MSQKRPRSPTPSESARGLYWSEIIEDRASSFRAVYSDSVSQDELCSLSELKGATHCIAAWRRPSKQQSLIGNKPLYVSGHDDDGERYAGKKLESLLTELKVEGVLVVARWYGGVLLGPVRFTHILGCAKEAVGKWKQSENAKHKRQKRLEEETKQKPQLIGLLNQRDQSISVLRGLLAEKQKQESSLPVSSSLPKPNYEAMEIQVLRRIEKARDATIGFILAQIEKAEKAQES